MILGTEGQSLRCLHFLPELPVPATVLPLRLGAVDLDHNFEGWHNFKPSEPVPALWLGEQVGEETGDPDSNLGIPVAWEDMFALFSSEFLASTGMDILSLK